MHNGLISIKSSLRQSYVLVIGIGVHCPIMPHVTPGLLMAYLGTLLF